VTRRRARRAASQPAAGLLVAALLVAACGKKGPPLPPLRPVPARITDLAARRAADRVTLTFTVADRNTDGSTPTAVERVEIYRDVAAVEAVAGAEAPPAGARPPQPATPLVSDENRIATLPVARPAAGAETPPAAGADQVVPGRPVTYDDPLPAGAAPADVTWRYVVVPVAGRDRRPAASNLVQVPLGSGAPAVGDVTLAYDEAGWRLRWPAAGETARYMVLDATAAPAALTPEPIEATEFSLPVEFGRRRCFAVRPVVVLGAVTLEGAPSAPVCDTPADTFAPPAPAGLVAVQQDQAVVLRWSAVPAADLAGYLVLRGGGPGETLQPLVTAPMAATSYRDEAVQPGATYTYAIVAVDRATPPNISEQSNRETVVVRETRER